MLYKLGELLLGSVLDTGEQTELIFAVLLSYIITALKKTSHSTHGNGSLLW